MGGAYGTCRWEGLMEHVSGRSLWEGGAYGTCKWEELMEHVGGRGLWNM